MKNERTVYTTRGCFPFILFSSCNRKNENGYNGSYFYFSFFVWGLEKRKRMLSYPFSILYYEIEKRKTKGRYIHGPGPTQLAHNMPSHKALPPTGTRCNNNVIMMSKRRHDVVWRHDDVIFVSCVRWGSSQSGEYNCMPTSSIGNVFRVTGPLWGEATYQPPVDFSDKGQWRGALMFSLTCAWTNGWANNRDADELIRHCAHYDVTIMCPTYLRLSPANQREEHNWLTYLFLGPANQRGEYNWRDAVRTQSSTAAVRTTIQHNSRYISRHLAQKILQWKENSNCSEVTWTPVRLISPLQWGHLNTGASHITIAARLPEHRCVSYHHCSEVTWTPVRLISPLQRGYLNTGASHITIAARLPEHRCVSYHHCSEVTWTPVRLISPLQWGHLNTGASQFTGNSTVCPWNSFFRPKTKKTSTPHITGPLSRQTSSNAEGVSMPWVGSHFVVKAPLIWIWKKKTLTSSWIWEVLNFPHMYKISIFQCLVKIFCMVFQSEPLKFHIKYLTHTFKNMIFIQSWSFKSSYT